MLVFAWFQAVLSGKVRFEAKDSLYNDLIKVKSATVALL